MLQEDVLRKVHGITGFEKIEVAVDIVEKLPNDEEKWPEDIEKFSVQHLLQYSSKKEASRTVWNELKRDMCLVEGGKWLNDRFTPMTLRPRRGLRKKPGLGIVDMGIGVMFCPSSLGDSGVFKSGLILSVRIDYDLRLLHRDTTQTQCIPCAFPDKGNKNSISRLVRYSSAQLNIFED